MSETVTATTDRSEWTELDWLVAEEGAALKGTVKRLREAAEGLAEQMARVVRHLDADGTEAHVNSLGECQGRAHDVDRLCALMAAERHALARLVHVNDRTKAGH